MRGHTEIKQKVMSVMLFWWSKLLFHQCMHSSNVEPVERNMRLYARKFNQKSKPVTSVCCDEWNARLLRLLRACVLNTTLWQFLGEDMSLVNRKTCISFKSSNCLEKRKEKKSSHDI